MIIFLQYGLHLIRYNATVTHSRMKMAIIATWSYFLLVEITHLSVPNWTTLHSGMTCRARCVLNPDMLRARLAVDFMFLLVTIAVYAFKSVLRRLETGASTALWPSRRTRFGQTFAKEIELEIYNCWISA